jgi:hypothetical protein
MDTGHVRNPITYQAPTDYFLRHTAMVDGMVSQHSMHLCPKEHRRLKILSTWAEQHIVGSIPRPECVHKGSCSRSYRTTYDVASNQQADAVPRCKVHGSRQ